MCFPLLPSSYSINISSCLLCDPACHYCASSKENSFHAADFSTVAETRLWTSELTIRQCLLQSGASRSGNVPDNQWTAERCSKGHNHQRTLLPPANMCHFRCSNYLNVQKLSNGAHINFWVQKHLPTSLSQQTQWHKEHGCAKWFFCLLWLLLVKIVWYDASEILGKSLGRLYDINCLLCQTIQHLTFSKLRLSHNWQHWLAILTALFWHLNWNVLLKPKKVLVLWHCFSCKRNKPECLDSILTCWKKSCSFFRVSMRWELLRKCEGDAKQ